MKNRADLQPVVREVKQEQVPCTGTDGHLAVIRLKKTVTIIN